MVGTHNYGSSPRNINDYVEELILVAFERKEPLLRWKEGLFGD
jgi:hypothetical protein